MGRFLLGLVIGLLPLIFAFTYGGDGSDGFTTGESVTASNMNEIDTALDALEARDTIAEHESVDGVNVILETEMDSSAELRALIDDEQGTGAILFQGGNIGAATATTPSVNDNDTSVATTAFVQGEINGAGGTDLTCTSGVCNVDSAVTRDSELFAYTVGTADPVDGSDACDNGDMWLNRTGQTIFFCVDGSTDDWWGVNLSDAP